MTPDLIQVSPATRRFNAIVSWFDALTCGQHDRYEPSQILSWLSETRQTTYHHEFGMLCIELGYSLVDVHGWPCSDPETLEADTLRLAHCWNCHEELVEVLQSLLSGTAGPGSLSYEQSVKRARTALNRAKL